MNKTCTVTKNLKIRPATRAAYDALAHYHYRASCPAVYTAIYAMYSSHKTIHPQPDSLPNPTLITQFPLGVIVYTMPAIELAARNSVLPDLFKNCRTRKHRLRIVNENIRCISRVIIDPRYRGLGLASRLVEETMPLQNVPIIEALAVMGRVNPFFEKAGMTACPAKLPRHCVSLIEAFKIVGIDESLFIQPATVQKKYDTLSGQLKFWLEHQIRRFMQAYGKRRSMPPGLDRTKFILGKLTAEPIYYIWFRDGSPCDCPPPIV